MSDTDLGAGARQSAPQTALRAFCMVGHHSVETEGDPTHPGPLPEGWSLVRASFVGGRWVSDPLSMARVVVCPEHRP